MPEEKILSEVKTKALKKWRHFWFEIIICLALAGLFFVSIVFAGYKYTGRVLPNVYLGNILIGGMGREELTSYLEKMTDKMINEGISFTYNDSGKSEIFTIYPIITVDENTVELAHYDTAKEAERLLSLDKTNNFFTNGWRALLHLTSFSKTKVAFENFVFDEGRLQTALSEKLSDKEKPSQDANVKIISLSPLDFIITSSSVGAVFDFESAIRQARFNLTMFKVDTVGIPFKKEEPIVTENEVKKIVDKLPNIFSADSVSLSFQDPYTGINKSWQISKEQIVDWLVVKKLSDGPAFGLNEEKVKKYLAEQVASEVNVEARDAKFNISNNDKAEEFQGSRPGIQLLPDPTYWAIENALRERVLYETGYTKVVPLTIEKTEPKLKTSAVNNLGINEILGIGISSFAGSPRNRILNIKNAAKKLNGVLIPPGKDFSTLENTSPFTIEGGYLPELVIKGDEIKPEVGGGLCQIGTTLFRMAMKSGMKIVERRNHSLVVNYYNDLTNGNPGTDATVYDPAPDFKFKNDTQGYVLIQTEVDEKKQMLYFTLWGTSDGREAFYSEPIVKHWLPYGEKKIVETTNMAPGATKCQHAYRGADTAFTYTRKLSGSEKEEVVFESHYRPLPEICLIGVEKSIVEGTASSTAQADALPLVE